MTQLTKRLANRLGFFTGNQYFHFHMHDSITSSMALMILYMG